MYEIVRVKIFIKKKHKILISLINNNNNNKNYIKILIEINVSLPVLSINKILFTFIITIFEAV